MKKNILKIELVAPAGGPEQLIAAMNAGADAVYIGYTKYGARAYAGNFSFGQLRWAAEKARLSGKKIYLTLNTILKDEEIPELLGFLNNYFTICTDGIIIQDMGLLKIISDLYPDIPVHASTQMNIHNSGALDFAASSGFARAVLAREMTLDEINEISPEKKIKLEAFGHGSQCYGYSGLCYFSSFTGGRSGNRGRCTQPCRMKYEPVPVHENKEGYKPAKPRFLLSKNDMCTLGILPRIIKSGIDALKIEGRMKTPEYVAIVVKIYRKYIDFYYSNPGGYYVQKEDMAKISQIFSRGLGTGYYEGEVGDIVDPDRSGSIGNLAGRIKKVFPGSRKKKGSILIAGKMPVRQGDVLEIWTKKGSIRLGVKEISRKTNKNRYEHKLNVDDYEAYSPKDRVFKYFDKKLDGEAKSLFIYDKPGKDSKKDTIEGIHSGSRLKEYLEQNNIDPSRKKDNSRKTLKASLSLRIYNTGRIKEAIDTGADNIIISDAENLLCAGGSDNNSILESVESIKGFPGKIIIDTPDIIYDRDMDNLLTALEDLLVYKKAQVRISNIGLLEAIMNSGNIKREDKYILLGGMLNISNTLSTLFYENSCPHIAGLEFSPEIDRFEMADIITSLKKICNNKYTFSLFGHGYFRVITARHRIGPGKRQDGFKGPVFLKDRKNYRFRVLEDEMQNTNIYNSRKTCALFDLDKVIGAGINDLVIDSIFIGPGETEKLVRSYRKALSLIGAGQIERYKEHAGNLKTDPLFKDYSRGHLLQGVE